MATVRRRFIGLRFHDVLFENLCGGQIKYGNPAGDQQIPVND
jgi:hypothetical protein